MTVHMSSSDIASARNEMRGMLTGTVKVFDRTDTMTASGANRVSYVEREAPLPALVYLAQSGRGINSEIGEMADGRVEVATHIVRMTHDANVVSGDRIEYKGDTFEIVNTSNSDTNGFLLTLGAMRVRDRYAELPEDDPEENGGGE
jgi:hypothetical protein